MQKYIKKGIKVMATAFIVGSFMFSHDNSALASTGDTVEVRSFFENIGGTINWDYNTKTITVDHNGDIIKMNTDSNVVYRNGTKIVLSQPITRDPISHVISTKDVYKVAQSQGSKNTDTGNQVNNTFHTVQSGDSLWGISRIYNITISDIMTLNNLSSSTIYVGQELIVSQEVITLENSKEPIVYTVQSGDSLWKISIANSLTVLELKEINNLTSDTLYVGQVLTVGYQDKPAYITYSVVSGDNLWVISTKYGVSIQDIKDCNNLTSDFLYIGQELKIPTPSSTMSNIEKPNKFVDGVFPILKGTYTPYSDTYGDSRAYGGDRVHEGVDIMAKKGTPLFAATDGVIINKGWNDFGGWRLTVRVDSDTTFYYAHLSGYEGNLSVGDKVSAGQLIGYIGDTGYGPVGTSGKFVSHLHFGIYDTSGSSWVAVGPYQYLKWWESKILN